MKKLLLLCAVSAFLLSGCGGFNLDRSALQHNVPKNTESVSGRKSVEGGMDARQAEGKQKTPPAVRTKTSEILVYYANEKNDPDLLQPEKTYPVTIETEGKTDEDIARQALEMLIAGPEKEMTESGFYTTLPENTKINSIMITDNSISVDFDKNLNSGGGSCEMQQRRSQIESTLEHLPMAKDKKIIISVEGSQDKALQP